MSSKRKDSKGRVLKEGESQRKDGTYQYRYTDPCGKRKCVYARTLDTLRDKENAIASDLRDGIGGDMASMPLEELVAAHIRRKKKLRPKTVINYTNKLKIVQRYPIAKVQIGVIKKNDIIDLCERMATDGVAYSVIAGTKSLLYSSFQNAVDNDAIRKNPASFRLSEYIEDHTEKVKALTAEELRSVLDFMEHSVVYSKHIDLITVMLGTGLRAGELCGLTLSAIDFDNNCIHVNKQLCVANGKQWVGQLKTQKSYRDIPMTADVREALQRMVIHRKKRRGTTGYSEHIVDGYSGFLLTSNTGRPLDAVDLGLLFIRLSKAYTKRTGKSVKISPHVMRHTFCTMLSNEGLSVKSIQYLMGHNTMAMLKVYDDAQYNVVKSEFLTTLASNE